MKIIAVLITSALGILAGCQEKQAPPAEGQRTEVTRYQLEISTNFQTESFSAPYSDWKTSLIKSLGYSLSEIHAREFLSTDLSLYADGQPSPHRVYISRENPRLLLIPDLPVLLSFEEEVVGTMGVSGISHHLTRDQKFAVLIHPSGAKNFFGVPLGDHKTESPQPEFEGGKKVVFFW